jgi:hypothetical protein
MSLRNYMTTSGIEPATFRFVAQHLNHCATAVPTDKTNKVPNVGEQLKNILNFTKQYELQFLAKLYIQNKTLSVFKSSEMWYCQWVNGSWHLKPMWWVRIQGRNRHNVPEVLGTTHPTTHHFLNTRQRCCANLKFGNELLIFTSNIQLIIAFKNLESGWQMQWSFYIPFIIIIFIAKPTRCTISQIYFILEQHSTCFGWSLRPSSGVYDCTHSIRYMSYRFCGCLLARTFPLAGTIPLASSHRTCMTYTWCCMYTVSDSWWGTDRRPKHVECCSKIK